MSGMAVHITFEPEDGRPVSVARVSDRDVLQGVARVAVDKAREIAKRAGGIDRSLGQMRAEEARCLEDYFSRKIPGFAGEQSNEGARPGSAGK